MGKVQTTLFVFIRISRVKTAGLGWADLPCGETTTTRSTTSVNMPPSVLVKPPLGNSSTSTAGFFPGITTLLLFPSKRAAGDTQEKKHTKRTELIYSLD